MSSNFTPFAPTSDMSSERLSQGLVQHIEYALSQALDNTQTKGVDFRAEKTEEAGWLRQWLEAGAVLDDKVPLFGEPREASFVASTEWMIYNIWQDDDYDTNGHTRLERMSEEVLVMLMEYGWQPPRKDRDPNSMFAKDQILDFARLQFMADQRIMDRDTAPAAAKATGALRL